MTNDNESGESPQGAPHAPEPVERRRNADGRFKKSFSGNPKGRPKKSERAWSGRQLTLDILGEANRVVSVLIGGKTEFLTVHQLLYRRLMTSGISGDQKAAKLALEEIHRAQSAHEYRNRVFFKWLEEGELEADEPPLGLTKNQYQEHLNKWRKKSRK